MVTHSVTYAIKIYAQGMKEDWERKICITVHGVSTCYLCTLAS